MKSHGHPQGYVKLDVLNVRAGGKMEALTAMELVNTRMTINATNVTVNGNGYFRTNQLHVIAVRVDVDLAGEMHADFSGEARATGQGTGWTAVSL